MGKELYIIIYHNRYNCDIRSIETYRPGELYMIISNIQKKIHV